MFLEANTVTKILLRTPIMIRAKLSCATAMKKPKNSLVLTARWES